MKTTRKKFTVRHLIRTRRGIAMVAVLLIAVVATVMALASAMMAMSGKLVQAGSDRSAAVDDAALSALETERSRLNAKLDTVPLEGFATVASNQSVGGGIKRSIWVSRLGNSDSLKSVGEFGVQAELVAQATDDFGNVAIRRSQLYQESFARYASFTDQARSTANQVLYWALGAQAQGPVHSNDTINIWSGSTPSPQATFFDDVTSARIVTNKPKGLFKKGPPKEYVAKIPMPTTADLNVLKTIATRAGYMFTPNIVTGDSALATMRIDFVAIDADGDGNTTGPNDGYFKVYQLNNLLKYGAGFTMARPPVPPTAASGAPVPSGSAVPLDSLLYSYNCGVVTQVAGRDATPVKFAAIAHVAAGSNYQNKMVNKVSAFDNNNSRCFLGGDDRLSPTGVFRAVDTAGYWMPRTKGSIPGSLAGRADAAYLWPLSASLNPDFRGVIFAEGKVAVSGVVRGRLTIASRNIMVLPAELTQATSPGITTGSCKADDDVIGLFSGEYIMYGDNSLATPQWRRTNSDGSAWTWPRKEFDPSSRRPDMPIHASLLAMKSVATENANPPAGLAANRFVTRGTTRLIGGTIEFRSGVTGTMSGTNLHGYYDDLSFNRCMLQYPPPYFPTTGHWTRSQYYEVNPQGFSPSSWFSGR